MEYFACGLIGVALGSLITFAVFVYLLRRREDRDLIERRLRACLEYREILGNLSIEAETREGRGQLDDRVLAQIWKNIEAFCREFRLTSWILCPADRRALGRIVDAFERELRAYRAAASAGGSVPAPTGSLIQKIADRRDAVDRLLLRAVAREHRRHRFFRGCTGETENIAVSAADAEPPPRPERPVPETGAGGESAEGSPRGMSS